jgi:hypothetical protein
MIGPLVHVPVPLGEDPIYVEDWAYIHDSSIHRGVAVHVDGDVESVFDFTPEQARVFAHEMCAAADRAEAAAGELMGTSR